MLENLLMVLLLSFGPVQAEERAERFLDAVRGSDLAAVKALLAEGVDVNTKYRYERMALSFAADRGHVEVVKALLDAGADVNARDTFYNADAMVWALNKGHLEIARLLLQRGAQNSEAVLTAGIQSAHAELVRASLEKGGFQPTSLTAALHLASKEGKSEIAQLLREAGATPPLELNAADLEKYAGTYRPESGAELSFRVENGRLRGGPPGQNTVFLALNRSTFRPETVPGVSIQFDFEGDVVTGLTVHQGNNTTRFEKVEVKP